MPKRAVDRERNLPMIEKQVAGRKIRRTEPTKTFGIRQGATGCGVCTAGFQS